MLSDYWFKPVKTRREVTSTNPTNGLVQYFNEIKPYHTKLLEVAVRYTFDETIRASHTEQLHLAPKLINRHDLGVETQCNVGYDLDYGHGFGSVWMGGYGGETLDQPTTPRPPTIVDSGFGEPYDTDGFSGKIQPIVEGNIDPVEQINANIVEAISYNESDSNYIANTFLVDIPSPEIYTVMVTDIQSSTFAFVEQYTILDVAPAEKKLIIDTTDYTKFTPGLEVFVNISNKTRYTISTSYIENNAVVVIVNESVPLNVKKVGLLGIVIPNRAMPWWPTGSTLGIISTQSELLPTQVKFKPIIDTPTMGFFTLDDVNGNQLVVTTAALDTVYVQNVDVFLPGMRIVVTGSANNSGEYTVYRVKLEHGRFRIWTIQPIFHTELTDAGILNYDTSLDFVRSDYCRIVGGDPLHIQSRLSETLVIKLGP